MSFTLQVSEPCAESWGDMTPVSGGRHCASCQKTVIDFTGMTDAELARYLRSDGTSGCGRFRPDQLTRPLPEPARSRSFSRAAAALAFLAGLALPAESRGKTATPVELDGTNKPSPADSAGICRISGRIVDVHGAPVAGARILITEPEIDSQYHAAAFTNRDGRYELRYHPSQAGSGQLALRVYYESASMTLPITVGISEQLVSTRLEIEAKQDWDRIAVTLGGFYGQVTRGRRAGFFRRTFNRLRYGIIRRR